MIQMFFLWMNNYQSLTNLMEIIGQLRQLAQLVQLSPVMSSVPCQVRLKCTELVVTTQNAFWDGTRITSLPAR